jgi:deoxycytidylate deaminase
MTDVERADNKHDPLGEEEWKTELVFGLTGTVGTPLKWVSERLEQLLRDYGFSYVTQIKATDAIKSISTRVKLLRPDGTPIDIVPVPEDKRMHAFMDAGDAICRLSGSAAGVAIGMIGDVQRMRAGLPEDANKVYILRSLKRPREVELLRRIYGPGFFLIGVYAPREVRKGILAKDIEDASRLIEELTPLEAERRALELLERDDDERDDMGQDMRDTFHLADLFLSIGDNQHEALTTAETSLKRFVELALGNTEHSPTMDEAMMFLAHAAAARSSSLSRQVGAVVATNRGEALGVGCNDVPRAGGGLYWSSDHNDDRDVLRDRDSSNEHADANLRDILRILQTAGWINGQRTVEEAWQLLGRTRWMNLLEFGRTAHAEMEAILSTARAGVSPKGRVLYTTTYPCHECARLILDAGIRRVVYVEPYPKSLALKLHGNAIVQVQAACDCDQCDGPDFVEFLPFVGIGPRRYLDLFLLTTSTGSKVERKLKTGERIKWSKASARPRLILPPLSYSEMETKVLSDLATHLHQDDRAEVAQPAAEYTPEGATDAKLSERPVDDPRGR